jgi:hypothetical protein
LSALKYLRAEEAEAPSFAVGFVRFACSSFALDHHRIREHATAAHLGEPAAGLWLLVAANGPSRKIVPWVTKSSGN